MCSQNQLNEILKKVVDEAKSIFELKLNSVILFGSYARGDYDEDSDIDVLILVDLPYDELIAYRPHIDSLCGKLLFEYGVVVSAIEKDLKTYNQYANVLPFYKNILKDGVRIA